MGQDILIRNALIVNAESSVENDVLCRNGSIHAIGQNLEALSRNPLNIDAKGKYLFPGGIDPHVHMQLPTPAGPSCDNFSTGSRAAVFGGTTTLIDFVTPHRGQSLVEALKQRKAEAQDSFTDYSFHVSPVEWRETIKDEVRECIENEGITSFKTYMAYKSSVGLDDVDLRKVMKLVGGFGGMVTVHCELGDEIELMRNLLASQGYLSPAAHPLSRPPSMESEAVRIAIQMAAEEDCPLYIVHISSRESLDHIALAQQRGHKVWAETCPQYLLLHDEFYTADFVQACAFVMSPPLRKIEDNIALWEALDKGVLQTTGTDHCPFTLRQKELGIRDFRKIPNGAGGVEHRLSLLYTFGVLENRISLNQFVAVSSTNAAKIFGLYPAKGIIKEGSDADMVIWNPEKENIISASSHHQNSDLNVFEGFKTRGRAEYVIRRGEVLIENGIFKEGQSAGRYLRRK